MLSIHRFEEVAFSFNGGKDSTVIISSCLFVYVKFRLALLKFVNLILINLDVIGSAGLAAFTASWILFA